MSKEFFPQRPESRPHKITPGNLFVISIRHGKMDGERRKSNGRA